MKKKLFLPAVLTATLLFISVTTIGISHTSRLPFMSKADLVITEIWDEQRTICYNITNIGKKKAGPSNSALILDGEGIMRDYSVPALDPKEKITRRFSAAKMPFGTHEITVIADCSNLVSESNESNNSKTETLSFEFPEEITLD